MNDQYQIIYRDQPEWAIIGQGINAYNEQQAGPDSARHLCYVLRGPAEEIVGGIIGATHWDWFYVDLMWIREDVRGRGYGQQLLARAEEEARRRGAHHAHLDTFSFQAPGFYQKMGYRVFGELQDFPAGHQRYYMHKEL